MSLVKKYDYYGASGVIDKVDKYLFDERLLLIGEDGANLLLRSTPIAFFADGQYWVNNHAHVIDSVDKTILDWVCLYINSISVAPYVTGTAQPKMNQDKMSSILIAIPPIDEQRAIIDKITSIQGLITDYKKINSVLTRTNQIFREQILESIIHYAIQGKLVPQDPNDKPVQIQCKNPIVRRDNSYYENIDGNELCIDEMLPFVIPQSWTWIRLRDISTIERGNGIKRNETVLEGLPCIRYGELYTTYEIYTAITKSFTNQTIFENSHLAQKGDILMTLTGETKEDIGKTISYEGEEPVAIGGDLAIVKHQQNPRFMSYLLNSPFLVQQKSLLSTGDQIIHIGVSKLESLLLPLPPIKEQSRIVDMIEKLLVVTNQLSC